MLYTFFYISMPMCFFVFNLLTVTWEWVRYLLQAVCCSAWALSQYPPTTEPLLSFRIKWISTVNSIFRNDCSSINQCHQWAFLVREPLCKCHCQLPDEPDSTPWGPDRVFPALSHAPHAMQVSSLFFLPLSCILLPLPFSFSLSLLLPFTLSLFPPPFPSKLPYKLCLHVEPASHPPWSLWLSTAKTPLSPNHYRHDKIEILNKYKIFQYFYLKISFIS